MTGRKIAIEILNEYISLIDNNTITGADAYYFSEASEILQDILHYQWETICDNIVINIKDILDRYHQATST